MNLKLAGVAIREAQKFYHGEVMGTESTLQPIVALFPFQPLSQWDKHWCAAFVYYCLIQSSVLLPAKFSFGGEDLSFSEVPTWECWVKNAAPTLWHSASEPELGDIVLYNRLLSDGPLDHMGIVVSVNEENIRVAEGNFSNISAIVERKRDEHIRGFIRIPSGYRPMTGMIQNL